jgi:hypothetical protein
MSMPAPPAQHLTGDALHTADHNTITTILAALEAAVSALQTATPSLAAAGGNTVTLAGTSTGMLSVTVSAVNRDGGADLLDFWYGSQKIFSLNSYGELRLTAASLTHVAQVITVLAGQSADAWQVISPATAVLARVGPDGSASFAGPVSRLVSGAPAQWAHPAMANGWTAYLSRALAVKLTSDNMVQVSGQIVPGTVSDGILVATMPPGYAPLSRAEPVWVGQHGMIVTGGGTSGAYAEVQPDGRLLLYSFGPYINQGSPHLVIAGRYPLDAS